MVVVKPTPRRYATIVVMHNPLHAFDISIDKIKHFLWVVVTYLEFALNGAYHEFQPDHCEQARTL